MQRPQDTSAIAASIERMFDAVSRAHAVARAELGLSTLELRILRGLRHGPMQVGALSRETGTNRSSVSMAAQRLEQRGMVVREVNARHTQLSLTDEARRQFEAICCQPLRDGLEVWSERLDDSPHAYAEHLDSLFDTLAAAFDARNTDHAYQAASDRLLAALRRGDFESSYQQALSLVSDGQTRAAYDAIARALHEIGDAWSRGEIDVVDERVATTTAQRVVERLHSLVRPARRRGGDAPRGLVISGSGESHELALQMVSNELELIGWDVDMMPGELPASSLVDLCRRNHYDAIFISLTSDAHVRATASLVEQLARRSTVFVGGQGTDEANDAMRLREAGATRILGIDELDLAAALVVRDSRNIPRSVPRRAA